MNLIEAERLIREFFAIKDGNKEGLYDLRPKQRIQLGLMIKYPNIYPDYPEVVPSSLDNISSPVVALIMNLI